MEFGSVMIAKAAPPSDRITIGCVNFITAVGLIVNCSSMLMTLVFRS
jgi:hypothetical protein